MSTSANDDVFQQIVVRLPGTVLTRIDAHTERVRKRVPGVEVSRAATIRSLLLAALASVETGDEPSGPPAPK